MNEAPTCCLWEPLNFILGKAKNKDKIARGRPGSPRHVRTIYRERMVVAGAP